MRRSADGRGTPLVCAVDIGTSAVRAALVTKDGVAVATSRRARPALTGGEFEPLRLWEDVLAVLADVGGHEDAGAVAGIGIAGHVGTVVVDESNVAVFAGMSWSDARGAEILSGAWAADANAAHRAGRPAVTGGALPFLCWLRRHRPDVHGRVAHVLAPKDYLIAGLTAAVITDETSAAYTLALDVRTRTWAPAAVELSGLDADAFPMPVSATSVVGHLTGEIAARTGLPSGIPVVAGGPDGTVGAGLVAGVRTDAVVDVAGTTDVVTKIAADPRLATAPGALLNPYLTQDLWSYGGPTGMTGGAVTHMCRLVGLRDLAEAMHELGAAMAVLAPGADGLTVVPTLSGSRFPDWQHEERASVVGMTDAHTGAHVLKATAEAAAYLTRTGIDRLAAAGEPVLLAGGVARSPEHAQLRADIFGRSVLACAEPDVSLYGAAALASVGAGHAADLPAATATMAPAVDRYDPDTGRAASYEELFQDWRRIRAGLAAIPR